MQICQSKSHRKERIAHNKMHLQQNFKCNQQRFQRKHVNNGINIRNIQHDIEHLKWSVEKFMTRLLEMV